jgi:hypothetical protein
MWCGKSHKNVPAQCREYCKKASSLVKQGVPAWMLFAMLDRYGTRVLSDTATFEDAARQFIKNMPHKRGGK